MVVCQWYGSTNELQIGTFRNIANHFVKKEDFEIVEIL